MKVCNMNNAEQVRVVVRCRPMNLKEFNAGFKNVVNVAASQNMIKICDPRQVIEHKLFTFDAVYDFTSTQEQLYNESVKPIIDSVLNGFNATIFAYGQTGTGKTYTMEGKRFDRHELGVIPRSFEQIFERLSSLVDVNSSVSCSYVEIYQEQIKDLLDISGRSYELRTDQNGSYIKDLKWHKCRSASEMGYRMRYGNANRKTGATDMNERSSRSHAIFIISIKLVRIICDIKHVQISKLNLVDLAGSERQTKSRSTGLRLKEATKINLSLSALGNVISALTKAQQYIPYRDSKLTRFLQDSLGGNSKTLMIANIGPACYNYMESLNTLKYANRAKHIKNKPIINEDLTKDELIRKCRVEIERLKLLVQTKLLNHLSHRTDRDLLLKLKIAELRQKLQDKKAHLYITCKRIEYFQEWKDKIENQTGMDVQTYTEHQQIQLEITNNELQRIDSHKVYLKNKLKETDEIINNLKDSNQNKAKFIVDKIESLHENYDCLLTVKNTTSQIKIKLENERSELEENHNRLLERHGMNQIIIENFIPRTARAVYAIQLSETFLDKDSYESNFSNESLSNMNDESDCSCSSLYEQPRESKFKGNIILYRDGLGVSSFFCTEKEGIDNERENTENFKQQLYAAPLQFLINLLAIC